jgi:hypothetical protein
VVDGEVSRLNAPIDGLLTDRFSRRVMPEPPLSSVAVPLSRIPVFLRIFPALVFEPVEVNRVVLPVEASPFQPEAEADAPLAIPLVTGSIVTALFVVLSITRFDTRVVLVVAVLFVTITFPPFLTITFSPFTITVPPEFTTIVKLLST